jgi:hypothetical protein
MYIIATFIGDDTFTHLIDTNKLEAIVKEDVETQVKGKRTNSFQGDYFTKIQTGIVIDKYVFPVTIQGMIEVYLE